MDLQEIRGKLDQIDRQFVELLEERLDLCGQVAADKIKTGKAVFDKEREQQKLASVRAMAGNEFNARAAEELFTQLMTISRRLQYQIIEEHGKKIETGFTMVDSLKKDRRSHDVTISVASHNNQYPTFEMIKDIACVPRVFPVEIAYALPSSSSHTTHNEDADLWRHFHYN